MAKPTPGMGRGLSAILSVSAERSQQEWTEAFSGTDACVAPVRSMTEAPADPHLAARGTFVTVDGVVQLNMGVALVIVTVSSPQLVLTVVLLESPV